jgi:hypothetical protein
MRLSWTIEGAVMPLTGKLPIPTAAETERAGNSAALLGMITSHWVSQTVRAGAELRVTDHISAGARTAPRRWPAWNQGTQMPSSG